MVQIQKEVWLKQIRNVKEMLGPCIQCGTCTASCPNSEFMDITPRHMWRLLLTDHMVALFTSKSFILCSSCYYCTLRCPRGLELTQAMNLLKQVAANLELKQFQHTFLFYQAFLNSIKKHGRVNEMEFMSHYFLSLKNPVVPIGYTPLGLKLIRRKKLKFSSPFVRQNKLGVLFKKTAELEQ